MKPQTAAVAFVVLALGAGCLHRTSPSGWIASVGEDEHLKVVFEAEFWGDRAQPGIVGWVTMTNVSSGPVTVYGDPQLPNLVYAPPGLPLPPDPEHGRTQYAPSGFAQAYFALRAFPWERFGGYPDEFKTRLLRPGESQRLPLVLGNPLQEHTRYNPAFDDPASPTYKRKPSYSDFLWTRWQITVGYFPFDLAKAFALDKVVADAKVTHGGMERGLFEIQREITIRGRVK